MAIPTRVYDEGVGAGKGWGREARVEETAPLPAQIQHAIYGLITVNGPALTPRGFPVIMFQYRKRVNGNSQLTRFNMIESYHRFMAHTASSPDTKDGAGNSTISSVPLLDSLDRQVAFMIHYFSESNRGC